MKKTIILAVILLALTAGAYAIVDDIKSPQVYTQGNALVAMGIVYDGNTRVYNEPVSVTCNNFIVGADFQYEPSFYTYMPTTACKEGDIATITVAGYSEDVKVGHKHLTIGKKEKIKATPKIEIIETPIIVDPAPINTTVPENSTTPIINNTDPIKPPHLCKIYTQLKWCKHHR